MKTKPILIGAASVALLVAIFLFFRTKYAGKPEKPEITQFLYVFCNRVNEGNYKALSGLFEIRHAPKKLRNLLNFLSGKKDINGKGKPIANIILDPAESTIKIIDADYAVASIPAKFSHDSLVAKKSVITLTIHKIAQHKFRIVQIDVRKFLTDYTQYANFVRSKRVPDTAMYSPITLAAFKTAEQLKARYDSVIWFAHVDGKNFFYVIKGKWDEDKDINRYKDSVIDPYKMGLVNPDLKEVIPPEYDLIHNIGATFPGLVEVEKDNKKGFFDLEGKSIVSVNYDQIFPIMDDANIAVLRNGNDYFYLKKDMSVSEKVNLKVSDFFSKIKYLGQNFDLYPNALSIVTEYNSHEENGIIYIAPSYLADLNLIEKYKDFKNPLRKIAVIFGDEEDGIHKNYAVTFAGQSQHTDNWFEAIFYSINDYFLGGREGFYDKKNLILINNKNNKIFTIDLATAYGPFEGGSLNGVCDINNIKMVNDSLFEVKAGALLNVNLYNSTKRISGGPYFHYLGIKDNKLVELPNHRVFGFTRYVKMDDSYLQGCYVLEGNESHSTQIVYHLTPEIIRYMKNEIFADYRYQFKDKRWQTVFEEMPSYVSNYYSDKPKPDNINVDDSLSEIDKYNINFLNKKIKEAKTGPKTLAAK